MFHPIASIDYLFIRSFCSDDEDFDNDLPLILQDFLFHEQEKILEYSTFVYADDSFENSGAISGMRYKFLNILLAAARHNSDYAAELLCKIYKIYYRREYNQLKRFKTLSYDELTGFDYDGELFATTAARILTIAPFMGIDVGEDCIYAKEEIEDILEDRAFGFKGNILELKFKEEVFSQAAEDAQEMVERFRKKDRNWFANNPVQKFLWKVFQYHSVPSDIDILCEPFFESDKNEFSVTLSILRTLWPKKTFSEEEVELFWGIYRSYKILIEHLICLDENIDLMLGRYDKFSFELENSKYRPASKKPVEVARSIAGKPSSSKMPPADKRPSPPESGRSSAGDNVDLYEQIEHLQATLRAKDQTIQQLNRMYREVSEREKQNRVDRDSMENEHEELIRLREALYRLTREDVEASGGSLEEMERAICKRRIIIVGGHDNWVSYLKERFSDWVYIKPGISNTVPESAVMRAEYVFFFTDTISHGVYNKFRNVVQRYHIPYGYLHGTNIPMTVRQIYEVVR